MKCKLHNNHSDLKAYWVDWAALAPLWERNDFHPLNPATLKRAYHNLWFGEIDGELHFSMGAICYDNHRQTVMFHNGRNRTILLSSLLERVPLAIDETSVTEPTIRKGLLGPIKADDVFVLPDLPVLTYAELRT